MQFCKTTTRKEYIAYLVLWFAVFSLPFIGSVINASTDDTHHFHWPGVFRAWQWAATLFVAFVIHNYLIAPLLIFKHHRKSYIIGVVALVVVFMALHAANIPRHYPEGPPPSKPYQEADNPCSPEVPAQNFDSAPQEKGPIDGHYPPLVDLHDITMFALLFFLLGTNLGIKHYFKTENDYAKLKSLEHANLKQELEYLKYQVNPHFFMNTLNNIHALVDIDPEVAKKSIVDLSHMMRYVLYDGAKSVIPLDHGIQFLKDYIAIMRLRFNDNVEIRERYPSQVPNIFAPPMLSIPFVENAFKHGVSYAKPSFIRVSIDIDTEQGTIMFSCVNSKHPEAQKEPGGVGLVNVKKRLDLLYGGSYDLNITDGDDTYSVTLRIPIKLSQQNEEQ